MTFRAGSTVALSAHSSARNPDVLADLLEAAAGEETLALCNRIARRSSLLARHQLAQGPAIVAARDRLVQAVYGHRAPEGWFTAWCDGSSDADTGRRRSGIGVVLMDAQHRIVAEFGECTGSLSPFAAELAALEAAVQAALTRRAARLRVHTDCPALPHMWHARRDDDRLARLQQAARRLRCLQLRLVPRRFNRRAHNLARRAAVDCLARVDAVPT